MIKVPPKITFACNYIYHTLGKQEVEPVCPREQPPASCDYPY